MDRPLVPMRCMQEAVPTSLLKMSGDHVSRAIKMFSGILKYQGDSGEVLDEPARIEIAQKLLHQGLKRPELKDELYMQLLKQTRGNPSPASRLKAWELFNLTAASTPPSKVSVNACMHACSDMHGQAGASVEGLGCTIDSDLALHP